MIHHLSIPADDARHVAGVLAELLGGDVTPFGPHPGAWSAWTRDEHGTGIEVYPRGVEMRPGATEASFVTRPLDEVGRFGATHVAISVDRTDDEVHEIARREGWHAMTCDRGGFRVIEVWVENAVMLEILTPAMAAEYLAVFGRR